MDIGYHAEGAHQESNPVLYTLPPGELERELEEALVSTPEGYKPCGNLPMYGVQNYEILCKGNKLKIRNKSKLGWSSKKANHGRKPCHRR